MDMTLTEEQELIAETAVAFAREHGEPDRVRRLEVSETGFDTGTWTAMADLGFVAAMFPSSYGGAGLGALEQSIIIECLARAALPSPIFSTVIEAGLLLLDVGSPAQRGKWLPEIATGNAFLTTAIAEASGFYRPSDIKTVVRPHAVGWIVEGTKLLVRDAGVASAIICLGRSEVEADDFTFIIVPCDARGVRRRRLTAAGGEPLWEVEFDGVEVPPEAIVGLPGQAWPAAERLLRRGALFKAAELVGLGQEALSLTVEYAGQRVQFGRPIGSFQAVHHHCADMLRDLEVTRLLVRKAAASFADGGARRREVAIAKSKASTAIPALTRTAHQIHGSIAFYRDYPLELYYHRALAAQAAYGDAGQHRRILADIMISDIDEFRGEGRHELPVYYV